MHQTFHRIAGIGMILAFLVIVLGAWVRLSDAGLGCPDWPGCYGELTWPQASPDIDSANSAFPERPVEVHKAWKEMVHRYIAGCLVLLVLAMNYVAWKRHQGAPLFRGKALFLLVLILFQAALGMWTVTLKLKPIIVMLHLLGGLTTFAVIVWLWHASRATPGYKPGWPVRRMRPWVVTGTLVLIVQICLGGWTSANYSALVCPDLPMCMGQWWPETNFREAFILWREIGVDYEGGVLDLASRTAIHLAHRIGAVVTLATLLFVSWRLLRVATLQRLAVTLAVLVSLQFMLGLLNVLLKLPLQIAIAHNGVAALLLAVMTTLLFRTSSYR